MPSRFFLVVIRKNAQVSLQIIVQKFRDTLILYLDPISL